MPWVLTLFATGALAACGGAEETPERAPEAASSPAGGTEAMGGMQGMQMDSGMMAQIQVHMQAMEGMSADSLMAAMPMHRQMVANMIAQMNREMREMNMAPDEEWSATTRSSS